MSDRIAVMNHGRYEQLADPESLYERPATRFVAGFLGVSNLLAVTREATDGDYVAFRSPEGSVLRAKRAALEAVDGAGAPISLGIRPEKIRLLDRGADGPANHNRLDAVIRSAAYLGVSTQYVAELADGHHVTVYEQNVERATRAELWAPGEEVTMAWSPDHSFVVADRSPEPDASPNDALDEVS